METSRRADSKPRQRVREDAHLSEPIIFVARIIPVGKARHRTFAFIKDGRAIGRNVMTTAAAKEESEFIALADPHAPSAPFQGPVRLDLEFVMPIPASKPQWWREAAAAGQIWPTGKPDKDNLEKLVADSLTRSGRWWRDDKQIVAGHVSKIYGPAPETRVTVMELSEMTREQWMKHTHRLHPTRDQQPALL